MIFSTMFHLFSFSKTAILPLKNNHLKIFFKTSFYLSRIFSITQFRPSVFLEFVEFIQTIVRNDTRNILEVLKTLQKTSFLLRSSIRLFLITGFNALRNCFLVFNGFSLTESNKNLEKLCFFFIKKDNFLKEKLEKKLFFLCFSIHLSLLTFWSLRESFYICSSLNRVLQAQDRYKSGPGIAVPGSKALSGSGKPGSGKALSFRASQCWLSSFVCQRKRRCLAWLNYFGSFFGLFLRKMLGFFFNFF